MASVEKDSKGYRVRFNDEDGNRKTIRLSGLNKAGAEKIARYVESLIASQRSGLPMDAQTASWLRRAGQGLHEKLTKAGLIEASRPGWVTVRLSPHGITCNCGTNISTGHRPRLSPVPRVITQTTLVQKLIRWGK